MTRVLLALVVLFAVVAGAIFIHYYNVYARIIDARLNGHLFSHPSMLFAAPQTVTPGEQLAVDDIVRHLRRAGYSSDQPSPVGTFEVNSNGIVIRPGPESYHSPEPTLIRVSGGQVASIENANNGQQMSSYDLEPELLTTLFDSKREKRRLLKYKDLPPTLVQAVLSIEDRTYFQHGALNYWRIMAAFWRDLRSGRREQGASTITQQVARNFFLTPQKTLRRKLTEALIAEELEQRLTKQQILELYANEVYLGQRGTYSIHGFGEGASAYFNRSVSQLTLPQCALLAGIIHAPNADSPYRYPERAKARRNQVLTAMLNDGDITKQQWQEAVNSPLDVTTAGVEASEAPYFVDLVRDQLNDHISERDLMSQSYHIYTTLDPDLQAAAAEAVQSGLQEVDGIIERRRKRRLRHGQPLTGPKVQVALIALDPHTGAVKALVGGRNYRYSQLDHVLAQRPTGSIFKPIVFAAALNSALNGTQPALTQISTVMDEPTTFEGGYTPANFENKYFGLVTLRTALAHSLNNATISLAQKIGYGEVADLAHEMGITSVQPTPSEAIGTYTASPLQMSSVYTAFANGGLEIRPRLVYSVQDLNGKTVYQDPVDKKQVLDPRVAFLVTNLMESVLNQGTAVRVRAMGFTAPAAGKTGTSHDGWFAGYTSNLLCVVWVGFDDYRNLNVEGAHSALPIWTEFMKKALTLPAYRNVADFQPPEGVVPETIDVATHDVITPACPTNDPTELDYFIDGTEPKNICGSHGPNLSPAGVFTKALGIFHLGKSTPPPPPVPNAGSRQPLPGQTTQAQASRAASADPGAARPKEKKKKKGFFGRLFGALTGNNSQSSSNGNGDSSN